MQILISFLRGVNIAGHNKIKMTGLSSLFKNLGFSDAETYIQSGNVVFSSLENMSVPEVAAKIEGEIHLEYKYDIPAIIRTVKDLKRIISVNPFLNEVNFNESKLSVIFLSEQPLEIQIEKVKNINYPPDEFKIIGSEIFIYCPNGFGRTKLYTNFFENRMNVVGTARNWRTVNTIFEIAERKSRSVN